MTKPDFKVYNNPRKGGGSGPEDPMLEERVQALELKIDRIEEALRRIESALSELASDNRDFRRQMTDIAVKLAAVEGRAIGIEGRLSAVPTTWQTIAIVATLLIGLSGIIFTASRFLHP